jgi:hypothetical protein
VGRGGAGLLCACAPVDSVGIQARLLRTAGEGGAGGHVTVAEGEYVVERAYVWEYIAKGGEECVATWEGMELAESA